MNYHQDLSILLKMQISLTQLRDDLQVFDHSDNTGILLYIERSLNTLINQLSEKTHYEQILYYSKEEFLAEDLEDWSSSPTIPLKPGELDTIYSILETGL